MGWSQLGVLVLGLCCAAPVVWGQEYVNIVPGKTYNQSSSLGSSYRASNVADGNTDSSPFFHTNNDNKPFWEVDLGRKYPVLNITVWSLNIGSSDSYLFPYTITVDGQHCVSVNSKSTSARNHSVTCSSIIYGQKVRITKTATGSLAFSEFEILACTPGLYGDNCTQTCRPSKCLDNTCHPDTGLCIECGGNFNGSTCSECKAGYYRSGDSCYPCSSLCAGSQCDPSNGSCIGCVDGRHGATCTTTCSPAGCQTCHQHNGQCTACRPLYNLDPTSQCKACKDGFSKHNSSICSPCSTSCKDRKCNGDTGDCTQGCVDGRHGATCNTTCSPAGCQTCRQHNGQCTACRPLYNLDPTSQCKECKDGFSKHNSSICSPCSVSCKDRLCHGDTGDCVQGCRPGYHGQQCEELCSTIADQCVQCNQSGECTACSGHFQPPQCTACREGFYLKTEGADHCTECTWTCHNNIPCNHSTGDCDRCHAGWEGPRCLQRMKDESSQQSSVPVVGAILGAGLMLTIAVLSVLVFLCWKHRSQKTVQDAETVAASSSDPVTASNNVYTAPPTASSSISPSASAQAGDVTQHEIRDPGNTYEQLRIYSNMVFDREAHSEPEPRGTDVTKALSTSEHVHVSVEHVYANTSTATKERKPRKKKAN